MISDALSGTGSLYAAQQPTADRQPTNNSQLKQDERNLHTIAQITPIPFTISIKNYELRIKNLVSYLN